MSTRCIAILQRVPRREGRCVAAARWAVAFVATASLLLGGWTAVPVTGGIGRIVVVHSKKAEQFEQAEEAFRKTWRSGSRIESVVLADVELASLARVTSDGTVAYVAMGTDAASKLAKHLPANVPMTFCMVSEPEAAGVIDRERTAGVRLDVTMSDQMEIIRTTLPNARSIGVLRRAGSAKGQRAVDELKASLPAGWTVVAEEVAGAQEVADGIERLLSANVDVVWTYADSSLFDSATVKALLLATIRKRVAVFGYSTPFVRAGALMGVGVEPAEQGSQAAEGLRELESSGSENRGQIASPRFVFSLNKIVAEKLSVSLSDAVVREADVVFDRE